MFENLTTRLGWVLDGLRGRGRLTEEDVNAALREVRMALLEADVALPVVKNFIERVRVAATGAEVLKSLTPGQVVIGIVHRELVATLGESPVLELRARAPAVVLLAGLQGAGKTTTAAKLALWIRSRLNKRVLLASADVHRPAAIAQLAKLAHEIKVPCTESDDMTVIGRAAAAVEEAKRRSVEVLILDTAGRLTVDEAMMDEIARVHELVEPAATLFVVDAMTGQDAVRTASIFHERLPLTGVVLTKADGDARGGAALSVRAVTGAPLLFLGTGERLYGLEAFDADRIARRMLGMGDIVGLVEAAQQAEFDEIEARKVAERLRSGGGFTLEDFRDQMRQMDRMGGFGAVMAHLPAHLANNPAASQGERTMKRIGAIIDSMTREERFTPDLIKASRKRRIAAGSGTSVPEVNRALKQFRDAQTMMKRLGSGGGLAKLMKRLR